MPPRIAPSQVLKDLRSGPSSSRPLTVREVSAAASKYPPQFAVSMHVLFYRMVEAVLRRSGRGMIDRYVAFSTPWRSSVDTDETNYFFGSLDAYQRAVQAGIRELDWENSAGARRVARRLADAAPDESTVEGLAWQVLLGQVQSIYSRDAAAATFSLVRSHPRVGLVKDFYRDTGALTYYGEQEVQARRREIPPLSQMGTWVTGSEGGSDHALLISMDPNFFRIYAPMILHNAQQLPTVDFVIVLCATAEESITLQHDAGAYLVGLTALNRQPSPSNVRIVSEPTPGWVGNERTFYASARFLALPGLLGEYESIYAMDADLFMTQDPRPFLESVTTALSVPCTEGPLGVSPWRRFMAGSAIVNRDYLDSPMRARLEDYLSVGLVEASSWMLDQNALAYAAEGVPSFRPITRDRPVRVGSFMGQWERNYRVASAL